MAAITLGDPSLSHIRLSDFGPLDDLRNAYFRACPEICIERPLLITEFHEKHGLFKQNRISVLDKAKAYRYVLERRVPMVRHGSGYEKASTVPFSGKSVLKRFSFEDSSPFAGSTTSKFKGVPLYPELIALIMWPELSSVGTRQANPFHLSKAEAEELNVRVFPRWMNHSISELARKRYYPWGTGASRYDDMRLLQNMVFFLTSKPLCISHTIPDFSRAVGVGLNAMIDQAADRMAAADDEAKIEFYSALMEVLQGITAYAHRLADRAAYLAGLQTRDEDKERLLETARIYRKVPANPASTFREGLTTVWICWTAIHLENPNVGLSLGRLDRLLYPLYERDVKDGRLTPDDAVELVCYFWLKIGDHVPTMPETGEQLFGGTGSNQAITVGGVDDDGGDAVNDLTYVILRAVELMKLRDPNLNARYHPHVNTRDYLKRLCEVNISTGATPAIHNDKAVIKALTAKGDKPVWAKDYGIVGCVEPGSNGRHYGHSASILLNLPSVLELTLFRGKHRRTGLGRSDPQIGPVTGDPADFTSFEQFMDAFEEQALHLIDRSVRLNNNLGKVHQDYYPTPILSSFFEGPMDNGKDLIQGGAAINSSGVAVIGLADTADSLSAIRKWLFAKKRITFPEFHDALINDFDKNLDYYDLIDDMKKSHEALGILLGNYDLTPKFGNRVGNLHDGVDANAIAAGLVTMLDRAYGEKLNYRNAPYRVGYWTMTIHAGFGKLTGALPSGRKAGENFASGITPVSKVTPHLTETLNSVAGLPATALSGGVALNLKFTPPSKPKDPDYIDTFAAVVNTYFVQDDPNTAGGVEVQFNIIDHKTFLEAAKHLDKHPELNELLVRVSGYTAYFKDLNPRMRKEIIDRTEYALNTGEMEPYNPFPL